VNLIDVYTECLEKMKRQEWEAQEKGDQARAKECSDIVLELCGVVDYLEKGAGDEDAE